MYRCSTPRRTALALAAACVATWVVSMPAMAQNARAFPATALRGEIVFGQAPEVELNGRPARLAPGARIRNTDNMLAMSGALMGERHIVHYTVEGSSGTVMDVWILRADEARKRPWPTTPDEARSWVFDPAAQTWSRR